MNVVNGLDNLDPDYQITEEEKIQIKAKGEKDTKEQIQKIKTILNREFNKELKMKENQLEILQQRILKTQKTLHLLRYILIKSYYSAQEVNTSQEEDYNISSQNRIHPAIKKLLGENSSKNFLSNINTRRKMRNKTNNVENHVIQESTDLTLKLTNQDDVQQKENNSKVKEEEEVNIPIDLRNRSKMKHRLIIGNISKWTPSDSEEDKSTHKWMVYVRGPPEKPDITDIIDKIVFHLHPSYKPNDVIEVTESPFHLSRRGWGEFPLRVQIHFKCSLNKPVDVIHNLKLDKTCSGRQTLGSETLLDVHLYDVKNDINNYDSLSDILENASNDCIKQELDDESACVYDNDLTYIYLDHNYSRNWYEENIEETNLRKRKQDLFTAYPQLKRLKLEDKYEELCSSIINFPNEKFNNTIELLPYLLKRLPLIHENALDQRYKSTFPFTATCIEEYMKWNVMKRISCEWSRSKLIKRILMKTDMADKSKWSTKNILWYARTHGFAPDVAYSIFIDNKFNIKQLLLEKESRDIKKEKKFILTSEDEKINVTEIVTDDTAKRTDEIIDFKTLEVNNNELCYSFIKQRTLDVGVILKYEELTPGVVINGVERMLLVAMQCLAENIIRDTHSNMVLNNTYKKSSYITSMDIYQSLKNTRLNVLLK